MSGPVHTFPASGDDDLLPINEITLEFNEPLNSDSLKDMIGIEIRDLPGVETNNSQWLNRNEFSIKKPERKNRNANAVYILKLNNDIPYGKKVIIHMSLSIKKNLDDSFHRIEFKTKKPFRITGFGSLGNKILPATVSGIGYSKEQVIECQPSDKNVVIQLSSEPALSNPVTLRNMVRFSPGVENLDFLVSHQNISISGDFKSDVLYKVLLKKSDIKDQYGRFLEMDNSSHFYIYFKSYSDYLEWETSGGIAELHGPKTIPVRGRNFKRADIRIYKLNPLNRSFWPFPDYAVKTQDFKRPPSPGEEPSPFNLASRNIYEDELIEQLQSLLTPDYSGIIDLPVKNSTASTRFGIDLNPILKKINSKNKPGSYLIGLRRIDNSGTRSWIRLQVSDLCLTTAEESNAVRFVITSLKSGMPVSNAAISVEGNDNNNWKKIVSGKTDKNGLFTWTIEKGKRLKRYDIRRIHIKKGFDNLVLNPANPPEKYFNNPVSIFLLI